MKSQSKFLKFLPVGLTIFIVLALVQFAICDGYLTFSKPASYSQYENIDTVATASTNDTSYSFVNPNVSYRNLKVEFIQNSTAQSFTINSTTIEKGRIRYLAADSSLYVESYGLLGYSPVPLTTSSSTNATKYTLPAKTGTGIFTIRGSN